MKLKDLCKEIPYKWRVQSFSKYNTTAMCVAYIDARSAMDLLDEIVGAGNWQDKYEVINSNLFCSIGILIEGNWVWKCDCGTESNMEKEKGQSSDAFKRAGVKWGIGRFLYAMEVKKVNSNKKDDGQRPKPYVVNAQGKREYNITEYINGLNGKNVPKIKDTPQKPKAPPKPHKNVPPLSVQTATLAHTAGMEKPAYLALLSRVSGIAEDKIEQSVKSITKAHWDEIQKIIQAKIELDKGAKK